MSRILVKLAFNYCYRPDELYHWQRYFIYGLKMLGDVSFSPTPFYWKGFLSLVDHCDICRRAWFFAGRKIKKKSHRLEKGNHVGRYTIQYKGKEKRVVIDAADGREVRSEDALEWADIYFKSNMWTGISYPDKVRPITTGDISLTPKHIEFLKSLRNREEKYDLCFISRIWAGKREDPLNMVIHQVRLFETLAGLDCRKRLVAVISKKVTVSREAKEYVDRLEKNPAIEVCYRQKSLHELWTSCAASKVVFFRAGKHLAMPGRMLEYLAMGSCVVFDAKPFSHWYRPLIEGVNYVACDAGLKSDESLPPEETYKEIAAFIDELLSDPEKIKEIKRSNAEYYDAYASPEEVARYVIDTISNS